MIDCKQHGRDDLAVYKRKANEASSLIRFPALVREQSQQQYFTDI